MPGGSPAGDRGGGVSEPGGGRVRPVAVRSCRRVRAVPACPIQLAASGLAAPELAAGGLRPGGLRPGVGGPELAARLGYQPPRPSRLGYQPPRPSKAASMRLRTAAGLSRMSAQLQRITR